MIYTPIPRKPFQRRRRSQLKGKAARPTDIDSLPKGQYPPPAVAVPHIDVCEEVEPKYSEDND